MTAVYITRLLEEDAGKKKRNDEHEAGLCLLRLALKNEYDLDLFPEGPADDAASAMEKALTHGRYKKPYLKEYPDIFFNISHCRSYAACAVSDHEVGLDIERFRRVNEKIFPKVFTKNEQRLIEQYREDEEKYKEAYIRLWTLKEAALKQAGTGFNAPPKDFEFYPDFSKDPAVVRYRRFAEKKDSIEDALVFYNTLIAPDCSLSLCAYEEPEKVLFI